MRVACLPLRFSIVVEKLYRHVWILVGRRFTESALIAAVNAGDEQLPGSYFVLEQLTRPSVLFGS